LYFPSAMSSTSRSLNASLYRTTAPECRRSFAAIGERATRGAWRIISTTNGTNKPDELPS
jgi:hypothetical protein